MATENNQIQVLFCLLLCRTGLLRVIDLEEARKLIKLKVQLGRSTSENYFHYAVDHLTPTEIVRVLENIREYDVEKQKMRAETAKCLLCKEIRWTALYHDGYWTRFLGADHEGLIGDICGRCPTDACGCSKVKNPHHINYCSLCEKEKCSKHDFNTRLGKSFCTVCFDTWKWGVRLRNTLLNQEEDAIRDMDLEGFKRLLYGSL